MSDMVERVARAICRANGEDPDEPGFGFLGGDAPTSYAWQGYVSHARAAIQAMREPTASMLWEGSTVEIADDPGVGPLYVSAVEAKNVWTAMIDAALATQPTEPTTGD